MTFDELTEELSGFKHNQTLKTNIDISLIDEKFRNKPKVKTEQDKLSDFEQFLQETNKVIIEDSFDEFFCNQESAQVIPNPQGIIQKVSQDILSQQSQCSNYFR